METLEKSGMTKSFVYHVVRYSPSILRDEWVNIGVLLFDPRNGERRFRLIEEPEEYGRLRRMHPHLDEAALRGLRDELEGRCEQSLRTPAAERDGTIGPLPTWKQVLEK